MGKKWEVVFLIYFVFVYAAQHSCTVQLLIGLNMGVRLERRGLSSFALINMTKVTYCHEHISRLIQGPKPLGAIPR